MHDLDEVTKLVRADDHVVYTDAGYFRPDEFDQLCSDARAADVGDLPGRMIGNFVELFRS